jgi:hypothetical protein
MRLDREVWLQFAPWKLGVTGVVRLWMLMIFVLTMGVVSTFRWYDQRSAAPLEHYNEVSRRLESEQHTLDQMQTWRIASPSPDPQSQDAKQRAEQQQRDLVLRLIKERDALAEQLGHPAKPFHPAP